MLKRIKTFISLLPLFVSVVVGKIKGTKKSGIVIKNSASWWQLFEQKRRARYEFHSLLKEGDQYRLGEATVTLAKFGVEGKQEVAQKIAEADARREKRKQQQTEYGEKIMLMSPEELSEFKILEWLDKRKKHEEKLTEIMNQPDGDQPSGRRKLDA